MQRMFHCAGLLAALSAMGGCGNAMVTQGPSKDPIFSPSPTQSGVLYMPVITYRNASTGAVTRDTLGSAADLEKCKAALASAAARSLVGSLAGARVSEKACFEVKPGAPQRKIVV